MIVRLHKRLRGDYYDSICYYILDIREKIIVTVYDFIYTKYREN